MIFLSQIYNLVFFSLERKKYLKYGRSILKRQGRKRGVERESTLPSVTKFIGEVEQYR